ncbi:MAG: response regulator [Anaerolineae bacterium]|nr:response regulator [Anaerolineae bacterium]
MNDLPINPKPIEILLVEDNEDDVILTREGFALAKLRVRLHHVPNGQECLAFLRKQGRYADAPTPDLILLDLNMPVMDGREVLEQIADDETLNHLPIVILTTSAAEQDILNMYKLRCSSYIVKPVDFAQFVRVIQEFGNYWFTIVVLPHQTN